MMLVDKSTTGAQVHRVILFLKLNSITNIYSFGYCTVIARRKDTNGHRARLTAASCASSWCKRRRHRHMIVREKLLAIDSHSARCIVDFLESLSDVHNLGVRRRGATHRSCRVPFESKPLFSGTIFCKR